MFIYKIYKIVPGGGTWGRTVAHTRGGARGGKPRAAARWQIQVRGAPARRRTGGSVGVGASAKSWGCLAVRCTARSALNPG